MLRHQGLKTLTQPMEVTRFRWFDGVTALVSIGMFYFDVISDLLLAYYMYSDPETHHWFLATVLLLGESREAYCSVII